MRWLLCLRNVAAFAILVWLLLAIVAELHLLLQTELVCVTNGGGVMLCKPSIPVLQRDRTYD